MERKTTAMATTTTAMATMTIPVEVEWHPHGDVSPSVVLAADGDAFSAQRWAELGFGTVHDESRTGKTGRATIQVRPGDSLWPVTNAEAGPRDRLRVSRLHMRRLWKSEEAEVWGTALRTWNEREARWSALGLFLLVGIYPGEEEDRVAYHLVHWSTARRLLEAQVLPAPDSSWSADVLIRSWPSPKMHTVRMDSSLEVSYVSRGSMRHVGWRVTEWLATEWAEVASTPARSPRPWADILTMRDVSDDERFPGGWVRSDVGQHRGWFRHRYGVLVQALAGSEAPWQVGLPEPWRLFHDADGLRVFVRPAFDWELYGDVVAIFVDTATGCHEEVRLPWSEWPRMDVFWIPLAKEAGVGSRRWGYHWDYERGIPVGPFRET